MYQSESTTLESQLLKILLQLVLEIRSSRPSQVNMRASEDEVQFVFSNSEESKLSIPKQLIPSWNKFLNDRLYSWPDSKDEGFITNATKSKRLLIAPTSTNRLLADCAIVRNSQGLLTLSNIHYDEVRPVQEIIGLNDVESKAFAKLVEQKTGIIIASCSPLAQQVDATAAVLAARPDAFLIKAIESNISLDEILKLASSRLVVLSMKGDDPIELTLSLLGQTKDISDIRKQLSAQICGTFVHYRLRKVCSACARSTPVDPRTLDKLPFQLRHRVKSKYLFGRGCDACGQSAYLGTTGISSILVNDTRVRELVCEGAGELKIAEYVYERGTKSLLEVGLERILNGLSSFEEVFSITNKLSPAFAAAIAVQESGKALGDTGRIEALDVGNFLNTEEPAMGASNNKKRVMIVEDDSDQRAVLESVFRTSGYEVIGAENGQAALHSLSQKQVDLIICDVMMPVMNGAQFIKELRLNQTLKHLPVLMLTAVSNPDAECALLAHGADDYCEKNVKRKVLLQRAERLLQRKQNNPLEHLLKD